MLFSFLLAPWPHGPPSSSPSTASPVCIPHSCRARCSPSQGAALSVPPTPSLPPRAPSALALALFFVPTAAHRIATTMCIHTIPCRNSCRNESTSPLSNSAPSEARFCAAAAPSSSPPCVLRSCTYVIAEPSPASDPCPPNNLLLRIASQRPPSRLSANPFLHPLCCQPGPSSPRYHPPPLGVCGTSPPPLLAGHTSAESFCLCACCTRISFSFLEDLL
jgi:hypothetical protein